MSHAPTHAPTDAPTDAQADAARNKAETKLRADIDACEAAIAKLRADMANPPPLLRGVWPEGSLRNMNRVLAKLTARAARFRARLQLVQESKNMRSVRRHEARMARMAGSLNMSPEEQAAHDSFMWRCNLELGRARQALTALHRAVTGPIPLGQANATIATAQRAQAEQIASHVRDIVRATRSLAALGVGGRLSLATNATGDSAQENESATSEGFPIR